MPRDVPLDRFVVEPPKEASHGDLATNVAMVLCKSAKQNPRALAEHYVRHFAKHKDVESAEIAGPGFINIRLTPSFWHGQLSTLLKAGEAYGASDIGQGESVNVEYVSTNPTGPLHIGHCRVAVVGDVLAGLLEKAGYKVTREYYINDAGGQANDLARSTYKRYLQALGRTVEDLGSYGGDYLIPVGESLAKEEGDKWVDKLESEWLADIRAYAIEAMMALIKRDLAALNIHQDVFTSELAIVKAGRVEEAIEDLTQKGLIYKGILEQPKGREIEDWEPREQTLFRSSQFGDDVDRAIKKSDGSWTYFAGDMAYHLDKLKRGSPKLINVWGADHGGYVKRLSSAVVALSNGAAEVKCILCQMVRFMVNGQALKMSKRDGNFITVDEAVEKVGLEAMRFLMVSRKNDAFLDFDFEKAVEQSKDNPVFYVQYAYARCHSIKRHILETFPNLDLSLLSLSDISLEGLESEEFLALIKKLSEWQRIIEMAARRYEPHRITYYLGELAADFHGLWNKGKENFHLRFIDPENQELTQKHFALVAAVATVIG
ncbi:MAG: arginine--tRNA ligase, partial [Alphaproteobacteria bacterium]|nr:arginine--tRNA ligase [Alphaproteobacteria bacterium]